MSEEATGEAKGAARALFALLRALAIPVSDAERERVLAETDVARIERWVEAATGASSFAEVLAEPDARAAEGAVAPDDQESARRERWLEGAEELVGVAAEIGLISDYGGNVIGQMEAWFKELLRVQFEQRAEATATAHGLLAVLDHQKISLRDDQRRSLLSMTNAAHLEDAIEKIAAGSSLAAVALLASDEGDLPGECENWWPEYLRTRIEEARAKGAAKGAARAIAAVARGRGMSMSDRDREEVLAEREPDRLMGRVIKAIKGVVSTPHHGSS